MAGASGTYGYFFIDNVDETESVELEVKEEESDTNQTVEENPEDSPVENNDTFFRGLREECMDYEGFERCWLTYVPDSTDETLSVPLLLDIHGFGVIAIIK